MDMQGSSEADLRAKATSTFDALQDEWQSYMSSGDLAFDSIIDYFAVVDRPLNAERVLA